MIRVKLLRKCTECGAYTLKEACPKCSAGTKIAHPPKYSTEDKFAKYRRINFV